MEPIEGNIRPVIESISPSLEGGIHAVKRVEGESLVVHAVVIADGHDILSARLLCRKEGEERYEEYPFSHLNNDVWRGELRAGEPGAYFYTIEAWVDYFATWRSGLEKKFLDGQNLGVDLQVGALLIESAAKRAAGDDAVRLLALAREIGGETHDLGESMRARRALEEDLFRMMELYPDRSLSRIHKPELPLTVDRKRALFSSWYEMFPRSSTGVVNRHGTFRDCMKQIPRIATMGFDVLYFPPIHPVGSTFRKGKNNSLNCTPSDPGSPWAIGSPEGGFKSIHPALGTLDDFRALVKAARRYEIEVALDIAFQCSPDHPYVKEHPGWFRTRPDGSVQYAENPPKKYQDIYPFDFETEEWKDLWEELRSIFLFWIENGVQIFRVDNPHTKPLRFWKWLIDSIKREHPGVIFLAEAFTRPHLMYHLAKAGFTQSYTYFTWRNSKDEFVQYMEELTKSEVREYFRPNFWPNTPDILPEHLQKGGRVAFQVRLVLAATLSASYGIYGPAYELMEHIPREEGSEEYLDSEKYEIKAWDLNRDENLTNFITRVNFIRKDNPSLHENFSYHNHPTDNEKVYCYSKRTEDFSSVILVCVNFDFQWTQSAFLYLDLPELGIAPDRSYRLSDLLNGGEYEWNGSKNFVELDPGRVPAHIFRIEQNQS